VCTVVATVVVNSDLKPQQNAILNDMVRATASQGGLGIAGVYLAQASAPGRPLADKLDTVLDFPMTEF